MSTFTEEEIRKSLRADLDVYLESTRKRSDAFQQLSEELEDLFKYARDIEEEDPQTAHQISKLIVHLLPRWKEMTLNAMEGAFEAAASIYEELCGTIDKARPHSSPRPADVPSEIGESQPESAATPAGISPEGPSGSLLELCQAEVAPPLAHLSAALFQLTNAGLEDSTWDTLCYHCEVIKQSTEMFGLYEMSEAADAAAKVIRVAAQDPSPSLAATVAQITQHLGSIALQLSLTFEYPAISDTAPIAEATAAPELDEPVTPFSEVVDVVEAAMPPPPPASSPSEDEPPILLSNLRPIPGTAGIARKAVPPALKVARTTKRVSTDKPAGDPPKLSLLPDPEPTEQPAPPINQELNDIFRDEASGYLDELAVELQHLCTNEGDAKAWEKIRRLCHTIKGSAAMVGLFTVSEQAFIAEKLADAAVREPAQRTSSRAERLTKNVCAIANLFDIPFTVTTPGSTAPSALRMLRADGPS